MKPVFLPFRFRFIGLGKSLSDSENLSFGTRIQNHGFTLFEFLLTLVITSLLVVTIGVLLNMGVNTIEKISSHEEVLSKLRLATQRMEYEIMRLPIANILQVTNKQFDFRDATNSDTNFRTVSNNGRIDILRGNYKLAENVSTLTFNYYDLNGNATTTPASIRRIEWEIVAPEINGGSFRIRSSVYLRSTYYDTFQ